MRLDSGLSGIIKKFNIEGGCLGMEKRVALLSIIVDEKDSVEKLNALLHEYGEFIIGRMGIPYKKREINIISIAMDAPQDTTSELAGKIGKLEGVNVKTSFSGVISNDE